MDFFGIPFKSAAPRKLAEQQRKAQRMIFEKKRPALFKPGPYKDRNGNARFLGRSV